MYYDEKARPIYVYSYNDYLATTETVKSDLDFVGKVKATTSTHKKGAGATLTTIDTYVYDYAGRLLTQKQKINSQVEEFIVDNSYDELGQLKQKGVGGTIYQARLQNVNYTYNIRGWLKGINNESGNKAAITLGTGDLFGFQINYNDPTDLTKAMFNGNISQTLWKSTSVNPSPYNPVSNQYTYEYDALNQRDNNCFLLFYPID